MHPVVIAVDIISRCRINHNRVGNTYSIGYELRLLFLPFTQTALPPLLTPLHPVLQALKPSYLPILLSM
jgi:hypothetical protein